MSPPDVVTSDTIRGALNALLRSAASLRPTRTPNPTVVALALDTEGTILSQGITEPPPGRHAEVVALESIPAGAQVDTLIVSLEPCRHTGRTPPCTRAIQQHAVRRVIVMHEDPDPRMAGESLVELQSRGVEVQIWPRDVLAQQAQAILQPYITAVTHQRPYVVGKWAQTIDGFVATHTGDSKWITGDRTRAWVHERRAESDAILTGAGTVVADNPKLSARLPGQTVSPPVILVDPYAEVDPTSLLFEQESLKLWLTPEAPANLPPRTEVRPDLLTTNRRVDWRRLWPVCLERGWQQLWLEAGPRLSTSLLEAGFIDLAYFCVAPTIMMGDRARQIFTGESPARLADAMRGSFRQVFQLGDDVILAFEPANRPNDAHETNAVSSP